MPLINHANQDNQDNNNMTTKAGGTCNISLQYGQHYHQKCKFCTNYQKLVEEKDRNIYLIFALNIAKISL